MLIQRETRMTMGSIVFTSRNHWNGSSKTLAALESSSDSHGSLREENPPDNRDGQSRVIDGVNTSVYVTQYLSWLISQAKTHAIRKPPGPTITA